MKGKCKIFFMTRMLLFDMRKTQVHVQIHMSYAALLTEKPNTACNPLIFYLILAHIFNVFFSDKKIK